MPLEEINIVDCICKMNPKLSVYITLRFYNEMTYDEMAQTLKQPVSTIKYKTNKALSELKKLFEGDLVNEKFGFGKTACGSRKNRKICHIGSFRF